ncbi:hypothetical protein Ancab_024911 [Ancistrocladus abbreviatus]
MSNVTGASRVSIPNNVRKTIQNIKEITSNHSEEDIYAMLKECSMDPNETTQRLLHLDTFHEVKRKRDKRKENVNSRVPEESKRKAGNQGRGIRSGRGTSSPYISHDVGGGRSAAFRKENGVENSIEKSLKPSPQPVSKEANVKIMLPVVKSMSVAVNGSLKVPDSSPSGEHGEVSATHASATKSKTSLPQPQAIVEHAPSSSDPVLVPSRDSRLPTAVGAIKREVGNQRTAAESIACIPPERGLASMHEFTDQIQVNQLGSQGADESVVSSSIIGAVGHINMVQGKVMSEILGNEENHLPEDSQLSAYPTHDPVAGVPSPQQIACLSRGPTGDSGQNQNSAKLSDTRIEAGSISDGGSSYAVVPNVSAVEEATLKLEKLKFSDGQHVIIPNHIQVPDSVKSILSFGSLDASFGAGINYLNSSESNKNSNNAADSVDDETAGEPSSCHEDASSTVEEGNYPDNSQAPSCVQEEASPLESNISSDAALKDDQLKRDKLPAVGPPYPVQTNPSYSFGFMLPVVGSPFVQLEGLDPQACLSNPTSGNSAAMPTSAPTPPPTQSVAGQSSIPVPPVPVPLFRQPYPPNYIPYNPYFSPFYVPPTLHHFFGHGGFPSQVPTGNVFLPPPGAAAGMKLPPYKPGTNTGTQAHVGMPSGYGVYGSSQIGYSPNAAVTSGTNTGQDLVQSALKESNIYPGQQSEGSAVWIPAPGRELSSLPINSFFNLPPPAHHVTIAPTSGQGPFTAVYHPIQTLPTPATSHPLLQQSQSIAGALDSAGLLPSDSYPQQQPQAQQINWNSSF